MERIPFRSLTSSGHLPCFLWERDTRDTVHCLGLSTLLVLRCDERDPLPRRTRVSASVFQVVVNVPSFFFVSPDSHTAKLRKRGSEPQSVPLRRAPLSITCHVISPEWEWETELKRLFLLQKEEKVKKESSAESLCYAQNMRRGNKNKEQKPCSPTFPPQSPSSGPPPLLAPLTQCAENALCFSWSWMFCSCSCFCWWFYWKFCFTDFGLPWTLPILTNPELSMILIFFSNPLPFVSPLSLSYTRQMLYFFLCVVVIVVDVVGAVARFLSKKKLRHFRKQIRLRFVRSLSIG